MRMTAKEAKKYAALAEPAELPRTTKQTAERVLQEPYTLERPENATHRQIKALRGYDHPTQVGSWAQVLPCSVTGRVFVQVWNGDGGMSYLFLTEADFAKWFKELGQ